MSNYFSTDNRAGVGYGFGIADATASQGPYALGTIVRAQDGEASSNLGVGEFIYLKNGVAETTAGVLVNYNPAAGTTTLVTTSQKNTGQPVAVSMAAKTSSGMYGWYQIGGVA